jgi:hypothetical protein
MATTLDTLYALQIPQVQELFIQAMENIVDRAVIEDMIEAIENNDIEALYAASGFTPVVLNTVVNQIEQIYNEAANITISSWPKRLRAVFNIRNPKVEEQLSEYSSNFITNISDEIKANIRTTLTDGQSRGINPKETALNIVGRINPVTKKREGGIIGLSTNQVEWVSNTRKYLENLDKRYFTLGLRDKRFDSLVKKAIDESRQLTKDEISRLITAYENKALQFRGNAISRTETMQAINRGEYAAILQNIENGLINENQVTKWWDDTHDGRTRLTHIALGNNYNRKKSIPFNEPFITTTGQQLLYPGDRSLGADLHEIVNCRCKAQYNIDF